MSSEGRSAADFDAAYYDRYYFDRTTRVAEPGYFDRVAGFISAYLDMLEWVNRWAACEDESGS